VVAVAPLLVDEQAVSEAANTAAVITTTIRGRRRRRVDTVPASIVPM
jgi:hypothetical protein